VRRASVNGLLRAAVPLVNASNVTLVLDPSPATPPTSRPLSMAYHKRECRQRLYLLTATDQERVYTDQLSPNPRFRVSTIIQVKSTRRSSNRNSYSNESETRPSMHHGLHDIIVIRPPSRLRPPLRVYAAAFAQTAFHVYFWSGHPDPTIHNCKGLDSRSQAVWLSNRSVKRTRKQKRMLAAKTSRGGGMAR